MDEQNETAIYPPRRVEITYPAVVGVPDLQARLPHFIRVSGGRLFRTSAIEGIKVGG